MPDRPIVTDEQQRRTIQAVYCRLCRDSKFTLDYVRAAALTADVLGIHPLQVWIAFAGLYLMEEIAAGRHPAARRDPLYTREELGLEPVANPGEPP